MRIRFFCFALIASVFVVSCQKDTGTDGGGPLAFMSAMQSFSEVDTPVVKSLGKESFDVGGTVLTLGAYESDWGMTDMPAETKSAPITAVHNTFEVSGYAFMDTWTGQEKPNLFYKELMTKSSTTWSGDASMIWPGADYSVRFAAVSPAVANATGLSWTSSGTAGGAPVISYTVQDAVASQLDLLECLSSSYVGDGSTAGSGVSLTFAHALTAVKFRVNDFGIAGTVKSVTIEGVRKSGSHVVGSDVWTSLSGSATYSFTGLNKAFAATGETAITSGANTLILMPQTCPAGAKVTVVVTIGGKDWTLESSLEGQTWAPGKEVTYTLSPSDDDWLFSYVDLTNVPASVTSGVSGTVATVKSFRQHALGFKEALPWTLQYSTDGGSTYSGTKPSWLTSISPAGSTGGWSGENITATATRASNDEYRVKVKVSNSGDSKTFDIVIPERGPFAGFFIAPAPLYYNGTTFVIKDDDWNHDSYNSVYGMNEGSYYFNFIELGSYFDADGSSFSTSSGDIDNTNKISYGGHDNWRLATMSEWSSIVSRYRTGATVNGSGGCCLALIRLTGVTHAGNSTPYGLLLLPDGVTMTGMSRTFNWSNESSSFNREVTASQLQEYLDQGCVFLPASGQNYNTGWYRGGTDGYNWTGSESTADNAFYLYYAADSYYWTNNNDKSILRLSVRLVRKP